MVHDTIRATVPLSLCAKRLRLPIVRPRRTRMHGQNLFLGAGAGRDVSLPLSLLFLCVLRLPRDCIGCRQEINRSRPRSRNMSAVGSIVSPYLGGEDVVLA